MAFQSVKNNAPKATGKAQKCTDLKVGASITGYIIKMVPSLQNPEQLNFLMKSEDGKDTFYVYTAGNIKYMINDGLIHAGLLTRIERLEDKMVGKVKPKKSSQYDVQQDAEKSLPAGEFTTFIATAVPSSSYNAETSDEQATREAVERASVKDQAAKFANAVKRQA